MKWGGCVCNGRHWDVSNDTEISRREKSRARHRGMRTAEQRRTGLLTTTIQQAMLSASAKRNRNNKAERTCHLAIRYLSTNRHKGRGQSESCCCGARAHAAGSISRGGGRSEKLFAGAPFPRRNCAAAVILSPAKGRWCRTGDVRGSISSCGRQVLLPSDASGPRVSTSRGPN